ncbi:MAG: trypsin-like peptidase domain-containing protein [Microcoleus sp. PH2017_25_DOB_D_A]|uniref:S1 family peptidase n=1 Tax=unclassified Microcoleus TaxID=2642155 RepID=UPI001DA1EF22|nr:MULTISPECIES: serine protease [unclassified Microcoleus]MCC3534389.1 trypsin-like peptidase domain-containing protein [Microcoleus sp. PH2017_25_DOB_D_A]MCC3546665.1 trypsin-like peptidase domain-containing protein [Microcoleus sp. PH2017_24_DOB_U_A]TAE43815.1 MAG: serine protease [Oscillatoriales cyanobacterium]
MKLTLVRFIALACIGGCQLLSPTQVSQSFDKATTAVTSVTSEAENGLSKDLIPERAKLISLRVYSINPQEWKNNGLILNESGSGVLMAMEPTPANPSVYQYLVLTANHVAKESTGRAKKPEFYIRTPDGLIHKARRHPQKFNKTDLALLYFYSPYRYEVAVIAKKQSLKHEDLIYVSGFPCNLVLTTISCPAEFVVKKGQVKAVLTKPLVDNYSIGYTNEVVEGTSGGPILNEQGEVVGINGRGEDGPSSQYKRADGSDSNEDEINSMKPLRWGIPIDFYLQLDTKKLFKEIPPLNQEFVRIGYIAQSDSQTNQSKKTLPPDPQKSAEEKDQVTFTAEKHKNSPSVNEFLSRLKDNDLLVKILFYFLHAVVVIFLLLFFLGRFGKINTTGATGASQNNKSPDKNSQDTVPRETEKPGLRVKVGNLFNGLIQKLKDTEQNKDKQQPIANILFTLVQDIGWEAEISSHDGQKNQSYKLYYDKYLKEKFDKCDDYWLKYEIKEFVIFIKQEIPTGLEGKPLPKLTPSNDCEVEKHTGNDSQISWSLYKSKKISQNAPSRIIIIEFIF